jgi:hypothetical protein
MKADVAMTASPPTAVAPRVCGPRSCAGDELVRNEHGQLTVRLSRDGQGVSA